MFHHDSSTMIRFIHTKPRIFRFPKNGRIAREGRKKPVNSCIKINLETIMGFKIVRERA